MSLEKLSKEIIGEAQAKAARLLEEGQKEANEIALRSRESMALEAKKFNAQTKKMIEEITHTTLSGAALEQNKRMMEAKKEVLEGIFDGAKNEINRIEKGKREEIIKKLCAIATKELSSAKFVHSNELDKKAASSAKGLSFKGTIDCIGGVIVENADGTVRVNNTFEEIFGKVKEDSLHEVASRVFAKN